MISIFPTNLNIGNIDLMSELLSPKSFLKHRRPANFSDSVIVKIGSLNRSMLEQHLETLTSRGQSNEFEEFARKLCEFEICPNLRPQTGPVGGGDSKVDSEKIPVATQIQINYFQGDDSQTKESFAFAFSAKKQWTEKVRSDVRKISELQKGYTRVYFVTNQYARDKTRASIEAELKTECNLDVFILDKTWILDRVFTNKRESLAIKELEMGAGLEDVVETGPLDIQRRKKLRELNATIDEAVSNEMITHVTLDNALDVALISAALELPRAEVDGYFERAIRLSRHHGNKEHQFTASYHKAWTTFFWFEDVQEFIRLYDELEDLAVASKKIFSLERLSNLWSLLRAILPSGLTTQEFIFEKAQTLRTALKVVTTIQENPSAALHAESICCIIDLTITWDEKKPVDHHFTKLKGILEQANTLIGFPFEPTVQVLNELDFLFSGLKEYEELQDYLLEVVTKRRGDIPAGQLLLKRGIQHLQSKRYYQSIASFGRSLYRFHKHESSDELVRALVLLAHSYKAVGLQWAARGALLHAASYATSQFWIYNEINSIQLACYAELRMLELQLGRIGAALDWNEVHSAMATQIANSEEEQNDILEQSIFFEAILGILLLQSPEMDLKAIKKLPDTLINMNLYIAASGLIYRLGGNQNLPSDFVENLNGDDVDTFFEKLLNQPARKELPEQPDYYLTDIIQLRSRTLGCEFILTTKNTSPEIEIAEYIIASLESFLATAIPLSAVPRDSIVNVNIKRDDAIGFDLTYEMESTTQLTMGVTCGDLQITSLKKEEQAKLMQKVSDAILYLIANTIIFPDGKANLNKLFKDEEVTSRAFSFSSPIITLGNVLGPNHKRSISKWINGNNRTYSYIPGNFPLTPTQKPRYTRQNNQEGDNEPITHSDLKHESVIRTHLWDEAGWRGALYMTAPGKPPILGLLFTTEKSARMIFKDWKNSFGNDDKEDKIHLGVARGVNASHPAWYTIGIGKKFDQTDSTHQRIMTMTRLHTMEPDNTTNLDWFVSSYKKYGEYILAPAIFPTDQTQPKVIMEEGIKKHKFSVKNAWEIGPNDIDVCLITPKTNPVIPSEILDAPVLQTLKKLKELQDKRKSSNGWFEE